MIAYYGKVHKGAGKIAAKCFGSEWSDCVTYQGYFVASAGTVYNYVAEMWPTCKTEANGGDPADCTETTLTLLFETSAALWYGLQAMDYCFSYMEEIAMVEEVVEEIADEDDMYGDEEY